jgi:deoxyribose-phosphate aldolase
VGLSASEVAARIEHTLLRAEATDDQVRRLCAEAVRHRFAGVCVNGSRVPLAVEAVAGSGVRVVSVVGFPLGAASTATKAFEAADAVRAGAHEIDMVVAIGALQGGAAETVEADIRAVVEAADGRPVKVILETCLLSASEKVLGCVLAERAGAAFVKTSTGFSTGGATVADVRLLRSAVGERMKVKASGGIRTLADALAMIEAGADRLGTSSSVAIVGGGTACGPY